MTSGLTRSELEDAISKYAPILHLHPDEQYVNCSIEWFLSHATLIDSENKSADIIHPTEAQLPQGPKQGTRYYFTVEDAVKPGNFATAKAYVNALWLPSTTYTDIQFWFFSGYNGPGTALFESLVLNKEKHEGDVNLAPLGEHVADWEYTAVRVDNKTKERLGMILSAHGGNFFYPEAEVVKQFKMVNGTNPIVYSSQNGHANFPSTGPNFTHHIKVLGNPVGLEFDLVNATAEGELQLDCSYRYQVVAAKWLEGTPEAFEIPDWVGYPYRWGPEGTVIRMDTKTLGEFLKAGLGGKDASPLLDAPLVEMASKLLHIFVKANMNGVEAPSGQAPWIGNYDLQVVH